MPRPKSPDGRRVPVSFKISEPEAVLLDSVRGDTERSVWLRDAALSVLNGTAAPVPRQPKRMAGRRPVDAPPVPPPARVDPPQAAGLPAGTAVFADGSTAPVVTSPVPELPVVRTAEDAAARLGEIVAAKSAPGAKMCPPHPKARVHKGLCGACKRNVGDEKVA